MSDKFYEIIIKNDYKNDIEMIETQEKRMAIVFNEKQCQWMGLPVSPDEVMRKKRYKDKDGVSRVVYNFIEIESQLQQLWLITFKYSQIVSNKFRNKLEANSKLLVDNMPKNWQPKKDALVTFTEKSGHVTKWNIEDINLFKKLGL